MRREWRNVLLLLMMLFSGARTAAARQEPEKRALGSAGEFVRLTVEVTWSIARPEAGSSRDSNSTDDLPADTEFKLEVTSGRVIEVMDWPPESLRGGVGPAFPAGPSGIGPTGERSASLGKRARGKVRARIEAPLDASVVVRGGDQVIGMPLAAVLERPQQTPPQSRLVVSVERLPWDSIVVDLGESVRDGIVAPGAAVPVSVAYNIICPEASEVSVRTTAVLRPQGSGDVLWRDEPREIVPANVADPPSRVWNVRAPRVEGTYILEVRATWEPAAGRDSSRLARLIRRRRSGAVVSTAVRRVALMVVDPEAKVGTLGIDGPPRETEVDSVDLSRPRSHRLVATGRSPAAGPGRSQWGIPVEALIEPSRRERVRGWFARNGGEAAKLDRADGGGLAWTAVAAKVTHPERPHRLTVQVKGGEPRALGVALVEPNSAGAAVHPPRLLLDACASGPPILPDGPPATFSWVVFPRSSEMVVVMVNRSPEAEVRAGAITLTEIDETGPAPRLPESTKRGLGLYLTGPDALDRFGDRPGSSDSLRTAQNLVKYLGCCGATAVVLPEDLSERASRRSLFGQADEDSTGPDRLEVIRRILARQGYALWLELAFDRPNSLPGLPAPDSVEALRRGLVRVDSRGQPDGPAYHPVHPDVREAMKRRVTAAVAKIKAAPSGSGGGGLVIRLGVGPTLLGTPDTGLDDATYRKFTHDTFGAAATRQLPGAETSDPDRFAARARHLAGVGRMPWLTWRSREIAALYSELNAAVHAADPALALAVVTPDLDAGPAGTEARRVDRTALPPSHSWRSVGLDLHCWPSGPDSPLVLRGTALSTEALSHDLATNPDLDALVASRPERGLLLSIGGTSAADDQSNPSLSSDEPDTGMAQITTVSSAMSVTAGAGAPAPEPSARTSALRAANPRVWLTALPLGDGPAADEPLGHALAALDARWVFLAEKAVSGQESRLRRFARVLCALPANDAPVEVRADAIPGPFGVIARTFSESNRTFLEIANNSPYPIRVAGKLDLPGAVSVDDLGRGLRLALPAGPDGSNLVLDLLPYGVAAIRIAAPHVKIQSVSAYPSEAVTTSMRARFNELSAQLSRLNHGLSSSPAEPVNPGFEPTPAPAVSVTDGPPVKVVSTPSENSSALAGWLVEGPMPGEATIAIDRDNPHSGEGSLKLSSLAAPSSVVSDSFVPNNHSSLTIEAFFRASEPATKVRVWIEGTSAGKPYVRRTEMTVSTTWDGRAVRASDVPAGGLDSARLRFELLAPGNLWIDDLHVPNETTSRSGVLNARRTLLEAIQAYRDERYAEFARLASSHWIRESSAAATTRLARATDSTSRPGDGLARPGGALPSALSPERKRR
jgi:hypothetical protein